MGVGAKAKRQEELDGLMGIDGWLRRWLDSREVVCSLWMLDLPTQPREGTYGAQRHLLVPETAPNRGTLTLAGVGHSDVSLSRPLSSSFCRPLGDR